MKRPASALPNERSTKRVKTPRIIHCSSPEASAPRATSASEMKGASASPTSSRTLSLSPDTTRPAESLPNEEENRAENLFNDDLCTNTGSISPAHLVEPNYSPDLLKAYMEEIEREGTKCGGIVDEDDDDVICHDPGRSGNADVTYSPTLLAPCMKEMEEATQSGDFGLSREDEDDALTLLPVRDDEIAREERKDRKIDSAKRSYPGTSAGEDGLNNSTLRQDYREEMEERKRSRTDAEINSNTSNPDTSNKQPSDNHVDDASQLCIKSSLASADSKVLEDLFDRVERDGREWAASRALPHGYWEEKEGGQGDGGVKGVQCTSEVNCTCDACNAKLGPLVQVFDFMGSGFVWTDKDREEWARAAEMPMPDETDEDL